MVRLVCLVRLVRFFMLPNRLLLSTATNSTQLDYSNDFQQTFKESHHENARIPGVNSESESFLNQFQVFMLDPVNSIFSPFRQVDPTFFNQNSRTTDDNSKSAENSHFSDDTSRSNEATFPPTSSRVDDKTVNRNDAAKIAQLVATNAKTTQTLFISCYDNQLLEQFYSFWNNFSPY